MAPGVLPRAFFDRPSDDVARDLIGAFVVVRADGEIRRARIVETEAYGGVDDPASHAYRGPTPRSAIMFGPAGHLYVYLSYGVHWCMNVVTGGPSAASAVLLRAGELCAAGRVTDDPRAQLLRGPGNLTRGLGVSGFDNGLDCCAGPEARVTFEGRPVGEVELTIGRSTRIGLSKATERLSRYFLEGNAAVSRHVRRSR